MWQLFSNQFNQPLAQGTAQFNQTMAQKAATPTWKIVSMTIAVLVSLALLDRFVIRRVVRFRMEMSPELWLDACQTPEAFEGFWSLYFYAFPLLFHS